LSVRPAFWAALIMTLRSAERSMQSVRSRGFAGYGSLVNGMASSAMAEDR
jgi:hypothetical protein